MVRAPRGPEVTPKSPVQAGVPWGGSMGLVPNDHNKRITQPKSHELFGFPVHISYFYTTL